MLTNKTKSKRKSLKELNSFRNKMGNNLIWFNSLTSQRQYDLLFMWKSAKYRDSQDTSKTSRIWNQMTRRIEITSRRKLELKHWIIPFKYSHKFRSSKMGKRNSVIDIILKNKNK